MRLLVAALGFTLLVQQQIPPVQPLPQPPFEEWLAGVRAEALTLGIREATVNDALAGLEPVPTVIERDRTQAEIVQTLDQYLKARVSVKVVRTAQSMRATHGTVLTQVSEKFGVPAGILVSVWGLESNFGRFSGVRPTIATLVTLATAITRASARMRNSPARQSRPSMRSGSERFMGAATGSCPPRAARCVRNGSRAPRRA